MSARRLGDRVRVMRRKYAVAARAPRPDRDFESRWTTVRGVRLHDRASREPPPETFPVVLLHGLAVSHRYLMPLAVHLAARYPVRAVDLPGFGLSGKPGRALDVPGHADHVAGWLLAAGVGPAAVLGNSFGCQVAVDLAARYPELVRCLVLVGPTTDAQARSAPRQIGRWLRDLRHEDPSQLPIVLRDVADAGLLRVARTFRFSLRDRIEDKLPAVGAPTLVTRGQHEPIATQRWAEQVAGALPDGELAVVPGSPHDANYSAAMDLAALVLPFLDRVAARPPG